MKKKDKYLLIIIIFLLLFSFYEIKCNFRLGGIFRDIIYQVKKDNNELYYYLNRELQKENEELKDLLNIDYSNIDYEMINASVIERNGTYWLNEITINKGKKDGISNSQIVVTKNGMVGKIISVSNNTSKVKLITSFSEPVMVDINGNSKILFIDNYSLFIKGINKEDNINLKDKVITLGLSNNYPRGILIGEIEEITNAPDDVGLIAKVSLKDNLKNLRFVMVLKRKFK